MTRVLIVGKTRMYRGICLGGIVVENGRSIRLLPKVGESHANNTDFNLGDIWDLNLEEMPPKHVTAPHTEDIRIIQQQFLRTMTVDEMIGTVLQHFNVPTVDPQDLFNGRLQVNLNGKAAITPEGGIPLFSTGFWRLTAPLSLQREANRWGKVQDRYRPSDNSLTIPYVGLEEPKPSIPAHTILRFSLSSWFSNGFWLQISGWFI